MHESNTQKFDKKVLREEMDKTLKMMEGQRIYIAHYKHRSAQFEAKKDKAAKGQTDMKLQQMQAALEFNESFVTWAGEELAR